VREELAPLLHEARVGGRIGGAGEALVEVRCSPEGGELHVALESLGAELNDLLGVCGTRVVGASAAGGGGEDAAAAVAAWGGGEIVAEGGAEGAAGCAGWSVRLLVQRATAPRCERCWRHIPAEGALRESESAVLADGWLYRGHPDAACPRWLEAAGEGTSG